MFDQIFDGAIDTAESGAVWYGAAGAGAGAALAIQQEFTMLPAIATVLGGHYAGHWLHASMNPKSY